MAKGAVSAEVIENRIFVLRGHKIILDFDLAKLYGVSTKRLKEQVKRNKDRFPPDFMFVLTEEELASLRSQIATSSSWGGSRYLPMAFSEHGAIMAANVLNSKRAIAAGIYVVRAFVKLRAMLAAKGELAQKLSDLERKLEGHDESIQNLFAAIRQLLEPPDPKPKKIGFNVKEGKVTYRVRPKPTG